MVNLKNFQKGMKKKLSNNFKEEEKVTVEYDTEDKELKHTKWIGTKKH